VSSLRAQIRKPDPASEYFFRERCWIIESWNDDSDAAVSIARARVEPGVTTKAHHLRGTVERYLILVGTGTVMIGDLPPTPVKPGDVVIIPEGTSQRIRNDGRTDLIFYCVCTPRFTPACYEALE
jgi:mannose-6-phosphate isomerase-like protein (cupin superfamily)